MCEYKCIGCKEYKCIRVRTSTYLVRFFFWDQFCIEKLFKPVMEN